ncbi:carbamoyltransferase HypF [Nocardia sp. CDC160]|uniref:carbamoyltransferase HypF n=1 Tax=Nocardia sp. CDC160 TaxID=3112166 RepID=UPI002DBA943A|nr:carbamoyltransferase HypF [Nocardia sp. CDC160]MEC3919984.1 carbamoyltransferase HypF [Nocardia sp. CDC160]
MTEQATWRIRVTGVVQGVGYRPFVYKLARERELAGWVRNDPEGVLIAASGPESALALFTAELSSRAPELARVDSVVTLSRTAEPLGANGFDIVASEHGGAKVALVPADTHVCGDCLAELRDPADRRYRYPFINCTNCGPRYSIIRALPYDRSQTTMRSFPMCERCDREYRDPLSRRFHAQPNACADCGPRLFLAERDGTVLEGEDALRGCARALAAGRIAAIKSIGGFHLAVDAGNAESVAALRARKRRDRKPFAVMVRDLATAHRIVELSTAEAELLCSPARPIVLARKRPGAVPESVAPRNPNLGLMLPSAPHHHLLLDESGLDVVVMTSGNISGYPIVHRNEDALAQLFDIADVILYHDREIEVRVDDSVLRLSTHPELDGPLPTFLRRARGYAPYPVDVGRPLAPLVAYGAELKTTVALSAGSRVYLSQHIGDLKNDETFAAHRKTAAHLATLYDLRPAAGVYDLHPQFRSSTAREGIGEPGDPVFVQHHHAHMAACMAENRLDGPAIGVIFDGAGYGLDDTIWGGEFLVGDYEKYERAAHLRRIALLGGDRAVHEPIRTGVSLALDTFGDIDMAAKAFPAIARLERDRLHVYSTMRARGINSPEVSSMGRLFDGVAALLDVCSHAEYEAQGPIELEGLLERDLGMVEGYEFDHDATEVDFRPVIRALAEDLAVEVPVPEIGRRFHSAVVTMVRQRCRRLARDTGIGRVVLSGGVFLNEFLLINCLVLLRRDGFDVYTHRQVPPNDGGIALGQLLVADSYGKSDTARRPDGTLNT